AAALKAKGFTRFIVAGGETSSIVAQTLGVEAFHIGPTALLQIVGGDKLIIPFC
ncbi:hypothetical protein M2T96_27730, partial [Klebsiella pneumoniae]|nr:hypothetical protein [Klebsiella pneumoniae]